MDQNNLDSLKKGSPTAKERKDFLIAPNIKVNLKMVMQMEEVPLQINLKINLLAFGKVAN